MKSAAPSRPASRPSPGSAVCRQAGRAGAAAAAAGDFKCTARRREIEGGTGGGLCRTTWLARLRGGGGAGGGGGSSVDQRRKEPISGPHPPPFDTQQVLSVSSQNTSTMSFLLTTEPICVTSIPHLDGPSDPSSCLGPLQPVLRAAARGRLCAPESGPRLPIALQGCCLPGVRRSPPHTPHGWA